ncbi:MAG: hypothetical protein CMI18_13100 [Opitutaceae bacterium]|nr:hypothetical protein [Opitutaceae bacterium]
MLYDRPYMRETPFQGNYSFLKGILIALAAVHLIQILIILSLGMDTLKGHHVAPEFLRGNFYLSTEALLEGKIWVLVTGGFFHGGELHLILNMLFIFLFGRQLEPILGPRKLCAVYFISLVAGNVLLLLSMNIGSSMGLYDYWGSTAYIPFGLGASGAASGLFAYFCARRANEKITFLLLLVIPCEMKPKWLLWGAFFLTTIGVISELSPRERLLEPSDGVAHSAHLGGLLAGLLYCSMSSKGTQSSFPRIKIKRPAWMKAGSDKKPAASANYKVNFSNRETVQTEVDRILDKINDVGFGALTEEEKKTLDRAKNILNK